MGTDVHAVFERKVVDNDQVERWEYIESDYDEQRHYALFSLLANVRNGDGFAGIPCGEVYVFISKPRGIPNDLKDRIIDYAFYPIGQHDVKWLGDHSKSWVLGSEILKAIESLSPMLRSGVMSRKDYHNWNGVSNPLNSYQGIWGPDVITVSSNSPIANCRDTYAEELYNEVKQLSSKHYGKHHKRLRMTNVKRKHIEKLKRYQRRVEQVFVQVQWYITPLKLKAEFAYFTDEIKRLQDLHGEIRMVFGFDS